MLDVHTHAIPQRVIDLVRRDPRYGVTFAEGNRWTSRHIAPFAVEAAWYDPQAKLAEMDRQDLDVSILSAAPKPLFYYDLDQEPQALIAREINRGFAEFCTADPRRLRWMAHVPLAFPDEAASVLEEAVAEGAIGVQIATTVNNRQLDTPEFEPFWSAVERLDVPILLHPAYERDLPEFGDYRIEVVVGLPVEVTVALERFIYSGVLDRHPGMTVIGALGGGFFPYNVGRLRHYSLIDKAFEGRTKRDPWSYVGQIVFDCFLHDPSQVRFLIEQAGPENVLIGTDASFRSLMPKPVEVVRQAVRGDEAIVRQIGEENPRRLFKRL